MRKHPRGGRSTCRGTGDTEEMVFPGKQKQLSRAQVQPGRGSCNERRGRRGRIMKGLMYDIQEHNGESPTDQN